MTDEQARLIGEMAGKALAKALTDWLATGNRNPMTMVSAEWFVNALGEAIGRGIGKEQKVGRVTYA